jgi:hypothetical protein
LCANELADPGDNHIRVLQLTERTKRSSTCTHCHSSTATASSLLFRWLESIVSGTGLMGILLTWPEIVS